MTTSRDQRYRTLVELGIALSAERNHDRLMERFIEGAQNMTNADGGTLYLKTDGGQSLRFELVFNQSLGLRLGGTLPDKPKFKPLALINDRGQPNDSHIACHCALTGQTIDIQDAYDARGYDFSGTKSFDQVTGYRTKSVLCVPLRNHQGEVIGVLQLINARDRRQHVTSFQEDVIPLIESLASQAAVAIDNQRLIADQKALFANLVQVLSHAIDAKSAHAGAHCQRVPDLTLRLARAVHDETIGPFADFHFEEDDWYALQVAAGLHDLGKITTPESIMDKATKLDCLYNRIHEIRTRFEVLKRDCVITYLSQQKDGQGSESELQQQLDERLAQIDSDFAFVAQCNLGDKVMDAADLERLERIASQTYIRTLSDRLGISQDEQARRKTPESPLPTASPLLADQDWHVLPHDRDFDETCQGLEINLRPLAAKYHLGELYNLKIQRGTLTAEDRFKINEHAIQTLVMLKGLNFPPYLAKVTDWASNHHEKPDGTGYPRGLKSDQLSIPSRMVAIADIFEALTASDRPYKPAKPISEVIKIMDRLGQEGQIDADLWALFRDRQLWCDQPKTRVDMAKGDALAPL